MTLDTLQIPKMKYKFKQEVKGTIFISKSTHIFPLSVKLITDMSERALLTIFMV